MQETYIYLITNIHNTLYKVYIGKTKNPKIREQNHKNKFGSNIQYSIIDKIYSLNREDWKPLETFWIEQFRQWGFDILNKNEGGGGPMFCSEETKQKLRKPKPKDFKEKISKANKGKIRTKEHKQNYKGSKTKEHKQNISKSKLGIPSSKKGKKIGPNEKIKGRISPMKGKTNLGIKGKQGHRTGKGTYKILDVKNNIIFNTKVECAKYNGFNINKMHKLINQNIDFKKFK